MLADYANVAQGNKLNIMGMFREIYASTFPARHPEMTLVLQFEPTAAEIGQTRRLTIKLLDADGRELLGFSRDLLIPERNPVTPPGVMGYVIHMVQLRDVVFMHPGTYAFSILVDNDEKGTCPLVVVQPIQKSRTKE